MSIRGGYEEHGVAEYYARFGATYRNPHEAVIRALLGEAVREWSLDLRHVLDLACGSGEVTLALRALDAPAVEGMDPYTGAAYLDRTGQEAEPFTFEQIAAGALTGRHYSLVVCSFALHLPPVSRLPGLLYQLAQISDSLLVLTPHKRPDIKPGWGWELKGELLRERVRARWYKAG